MARIETYPLDKTVTPKDIIIGSDGDNRNATRNYSLMTMLEYLGTNYNLQSQDLVYDFNAVSAGDLEDGELSTNNYSSNPNIQASGITNIYVSKLTKFGQLVDEYIETIGTANLGMMMVDMANYNNFVIFAVTSVTEVNANILNVAITSTTSNGSFSTGKVVGMKLQTAVGEVDLSNYVDRTTNQDIGGNKRFIDRINVGGFITAQGGINIQDSGSGFLNVISAFPRNVVPSGSDNGGGAGQFYLNSNDNWSFLSTSSGGRGFILNNDSLSETRTFSWPNKSGTVALLDDVVGDNLGNHTAIEDLNLNDFFIQGVRGIVSSRTTMFISSTIVDIHGRLDVSGIIESASALRGSHILIKGTSGVLFTGNTSTIGTSGAATGLGIASNHRLVLRQKSSTLSALIGYNDITDNRNYVLPDKDGIFAMLSDIPDMGSFVTTDTTQDINSIKYFYDNVYFRSNVIIEDRIFFLPNIIPSSLSAAHSVMYVSEDEVAFFPSGYVNIHAGIFDYSQINTSNKTYTLPNASGTVALENSVSGSFTTVDGKTITITNGMVTSIV